MTDAARRSTLARTAILVLTVLWAASGPAAAGQDVLTVGSVLDAHAGQLVAVPIYVRDLAGTPLGGDAGAGRSIQGLSMTVQVSPLAAAAPVEFQRAGVTDGPAAVFEAELAATGQRSWIIAFSETADPLSFTLGAAPPGDLAGVLTVQLAAALPVGTLIDLTLEPATTALANQAGTTAETAANGRLELVSGAVGVEVLLFADGFESGDTTAWD